jgi:hypothetical protein
VLSHHINGWIINEFKILESLVRKQLFLLILGVMSHRCTILHADDIYADIPVYQELSSLYHPTVEDLHKVQDYLTHGERSIIHYLQDYEPNARNFKIIGTTPEEQPQYGDIAVNCNASERENCLIVYASFNKNYPRGLKRLVNFVKNSDFRGHILYRIGGWPNIAGGSLTLAHVPYAFKVSFFKEAQAKGFKRALWLDTAILPVVSLNTIFDMIQEKGYFSMGNSHNIGPYMTSPAIQAFGITIEQANEIPSCSAGITGIDFTTDVGCTIVDKWYAAAQNKVAFFSPRSDQNALSIVLHSMGLQSCPIERLAHNRKAINSQTLLLIEREFVNEISLNPSE